MKKTVVLLALLMLFTFSAQAQTLSHVSDLAGILSPQEEAQLQQQAQELFEKSGFDVIIHTTNDSQRKGPMDYSFDYYHTFRDSARYPNGALLAVMFDTRDYYEAARGTGINILTLRESNDLGGVVQSKLSDGDYYGAFNSYIRYVRRLVIPPTPFERAFEYLPFLAIAGLVIGLVYALVLRSKIKTPKFKYGAQQYLVPNSLNLVDSQDIYLYQTVSRTKIQTSSSSGKSGGGFSSGSRGGTSYGGRGGKF